VVAVVPMSQKQYKSPSPIARLGSAAVAAYPFSRGRYGLRRFAANRFLVARMEEGYWLRISGVSGFEWKVFDRCFNEPETIRAFTTAIEPAMTVFDIGANVGYYAMLAAALVGPAGRVHAFEPTPDVAQRLAQNIAMNHLSDRIRHLAVAVGSTTCTSELYLNPDNSEGNSLFASSEHRVSTAVPVITIDEHVRVNGLRAVDIIKVDVEGAELDVLKGGAGLLSREDAPILFIEFNPSALELAGANTYELYLALNRLGYDCFELEQLTHDSKPVYNVLAKKPIHKWRFGDLKKIVMVA
jgi:FkbM family methyltransferase